MKWSSKPCFYFKLWNLFLMKHWSLSTSHLTVPNIRLPPWIIHPYRFSVLIFIRTLAMTVNNSRYWKSSQCFVIWDYHQRIEDSKIKFFIALRNSFSLQNILNLIMKFRPSFDVFLHKIINYSFHFHCPGLIFLNQMLISFGFIFTNTLSLYIDPR